MGLFFTIEHLFWIGFLGAAGALIFAIVQTCRMLKLPEDDEPGGLSRSVRKGSAAFLRRQCVAALPVFLLMLLALSCLHYLRLPENLCLPISFFIGGLGAILAELITLALSIRANSRAATAAQAGLHHGFNAAYTAASAAGFATVGLGLLEVTGWFFFLKYYFGYDAISLTQNLILFGGGSAFAALLIRLTAGIYAKSSALSAGPASGSEGVAYEVQRGPAAIADCVGDNVAGAAMSADLYGCYILSLLCALAAGAWAYSGDGMAWNAMLFPVLAAAAGTLCALGCSLLVKAEENAGEGTLLSLLRKGAWAAAALTAAVTAPAAYLLTGSFLPWLSLVIGLVIGQVLSMMTARSASGLFRPVKKLAGSAENGVSGTLISGFSLGMRSAAGVILLLSAALLLSFLCTGGQLDASYETLYGLAIHHGLYGVALAGVGMLSTLGYPLSASLYSPIADNADCVARMAGMDKAILERTGTLNKLGGASAALGRNLSAGAMVLAFPILLRAYADAVAPSLSVADPALLIGCAVGVAFVFIFISLVSSGVQNCVQPVAAELRRKLREARGRTVDKADPDYVSCVDLCARSACLQSLLPALFAAVIPPAVGLLLGPEAVAGFLSAVTLLGLAGALLLSAAGAAWDGARKRVETERKGGAEARRAAVIGDTVGDLLKDVVAPSLSLLTRLCFTLSLLFSALTAGYSLISYFG